MGYQKRFVDINDFLGNAYLSFLIIEIPLLTLHKTVSIRTLKFNLI